MYKCRLQELCQRRRWELPVYQFSKEGPDHAPRFQATVIIQDCSFSTHSFFNSSKQAQNATAKVAVNYLSHFELPSLSSPPLSTSASTPEVRGQIFRGLEARTKKQAEMSAAKIAYTSLSYREKSGQSAKMLLSTVQQEATPYTATSLYGRLPPRLLYRRPNNLQLDFGK